MVHEIRQLATAYCFVSLVAIPVALAIRALVRQPVLPSARAVGNRWLAPDVLGWMLVCFVFPVVAAQFVLVDAADEKIVADIRQRAISGLAVLPILAGGFAIWKRTMQAEPAPRHTLATDVTAGILTWAVATPIVLTVHFATNLLAIELGWPIDDHPLKQTKLDTTGRVVMFIFGACVVGPFVEEMLFRRVMVPWCVRRLERAWLTMVVATLFVLVVVPVNRHPHGLVFLAVVAVLLAILTWLTPRYRRWPLRMIAGFVATSALFAVAHASIWPTPIPLMLLAFALAWLMRRTHSIVAVTIAHGLFNLVSAIALLRS